MRKLIALVFHYSLNGLLADEGTEYYRFCFELLDQGGGASQDEESLDFLQGAEAHLMGRVAYEGMSASLPANPDHPWAEIMNTGRKVVFSRTLTRADWANTTIVSGDTAEEIERLRQGGDGHVIVWGGVRLWRSLMQLDLIDEWHLGLHPYVADEGTRLFEEVSPGYRLDLISSTPSQQTGVIELQYRRHREPARLDSHGS
jgi:dihydrofolate reductase